MTHVFGCPVRNQAFTLPSPSNLTPLVSPSPIMQHTQIANAIGKRLLMLSYVSPVFPHPLLCFLLSTHSSLLPFPPSPTLKADLTGGI